MKKLVVFLLINILLMGSISASEKAEVKFSDCVDGDTFKVLISGEKTTIRLLAIDTPETVHPTKKEEAFGKEASDLTCESVKNAKKIELEYDDESTKADKYGRHLAWVFVDDKMLQKELIKKGYAKVDYLYGDYKYTNELKEIEKNAKEKEIGIWTLEENQKEVEEKKGLLDSIFDYITDSINGIINKFIKGIEKEIKSIFK